MCSKTDHFENWIINSLCVIRLCCNMGMQRDPKTWQEVFLVGKECISGDTVPYQKYRTIYISVPPHSCPFCELHLFIRFWQPSHCTPTYAYGSSPKKGREICPPLWYYSVCPSSPLSTRTSTANSTAYSNIYDHCSCNGNHGVQWQLVTKRLFLF